jgi:hypothetical protein
MIALINVQSSQQSYLTSERKETGGCHTAAILVVVGFVLGFGAMWLYCHFFLDHKRPHDKS